MSNVKIEPLMKTRACVSAEGVRVRQVNVPGTRGPKGDTGTGVHVLDVFNSYEELIKFHPAGKEGDCYLVGTNFYIWSQHTYSWKNCGPLNVLTAMMNPDPRTYFLHILNGGAPDEDPSAPGYPDVPDEPDIPDMPIDNAYSPKLNTGKLDYMILA